MNIDRRQWLQLGVGAVAAGSLWATSAPRPAEAVEPVRTGGAPKFKFSLAAYSYRQLLQGKEPSLTLSDFIADCAQFGLEGTELTSYYFPQPLTTEYLLRLKRECFLAGLGVSGTAVGNDFGAAEGTPKRQEAIDLVKRWVDYSEVLGAGAIRIFAGHQPANDTAEATHKRMVAAMEECCDYAGQHGVFLALENHGGPTATAKGLLKLVHDVRSPWLGVNLDTGNFQGGDVYRQMEQVAPHAVNVQVKVVVAGADKQKEPADFGRIAKILRDVGYRGYVVLEYEEQGDPRVECPKQLDLLRQAFA